eukprot:5006377-Prymnesium_polylepis.1
MHWAPVCLRAKGHSVERDRHAGRPPCKTVKERARARVRRGGWRRRDTRLRRIAGAQPHLGTA